MSYSKSEVIRSWELGKDRSLSSRLHVYWSIKADHFPFMKLRRDLAAPETVPNVQGTENSCFFWGRVFVAKNLGLRWFFTACTYGIHHHEKITTIWGENMFLGHFFSNRIREANPLWTHEGCWWRFHERFFGLHMAYYCFWVVATQILFIFTTKIGEMIQLD